MTSVPALLSDLSENSVILPPKALVRVSAVVRPTPTPEVSRVWLNPLKLNDLRFPHLVKSMPGPESVIFVKILPVKCWLSSSKFGCFLWVISTTILVPVGLNLIAI